jgi:Sel1 repeat
MARATPMETEEDEIDDEIDSQIGIARLGVHKQAHRLSLIAVVLYGCLAALHWLFNIPASQSGVGTWAITIGILWIVRIADLYVETFISEFRIRTKQLDRKVSSLQDQLTEIASAFNSSKPVRCESDTEIDEPDNKEALIDRYRASAERGECWGQHNLGIVFYNKDNNQSVFWFRRAAEQEDEEAQFFLANLLSEGEGIPHDYLDAARWYQAVIDHKGTYLGSAEYALANMYAKGKGVPRSYHEAAKYWKMAAEHGYNLACSALGELYRQGNEEFPNNFEEAYFWFYVAVGVEDPKGISKYRIEDRDEMARRLDPESRRKVQERAHLWLAGKWIEAYMTP